MVSTLNSESNLKACLEFLVNFKNIHKMVAINKSQLDSQENWCLTKDFKVC